MLRLLQALAISLLIISHGFAQSASGSAVDSPATPSGSREAPTEMPVRKVVLFSSGVGYFEHSGAIQGNGFTELHFKSEQINDILKSLVLEDLDGGKIGAIVYPSHDPVEKTLKSFQVDITSNPSLAELLNQLRGSRVLVTVHAEEIDGTILGLEKRPKALVGEDNLAVEEWVLNIVSGATMRSVQLEAVQKIEMQDPKLEQELHKALTALSQARNQDKKPVTVNLQGEGSRKVRLRYVIETPIWKTSYRLILPQESGNSPKMQGWAIVENQTDSDWNDVQLSLVSGRPISFIENLYQPLYVPRPVVEPELYSSLRPQIYESGIRDLAERRAERDFKKDVRTMKRSPMMRGAPPEAAMMPEQAAPYGGLAEPLTAGEEKPFDPTSSIAAVASAEKMGELFQYTVGSVSLPRQRSAMFPILTEEIAAERISIYNREVLPRNPLRGVLMKNTTGQHLMQGPVTVLEGDSYAGDAQIGNLPPGQDRLLSYAVDLEVQVDSTQKREEAAIQTARIVKGVLEISRKQIASQEYLIENNSDKERVLIIEHPFRKGWNLQGEPKPIETTETHHRFKESVPPGKTVPIIVKEEIVTGETIAILPADLGQLEFYSRSGKIPEKVRDVLRRAMELKRAMADTERLIAEKRQKLQEIAQEQERIRSNMSTVNTTTQYYSRLLEKLNSQETAIENLHHEIDQLEAKYDEQRRDLENYLVNTTLG